MIELAVLGLFFIIKECKTEIDYLDSEVILVFVSEEDIVWFQVPVDYFIHVKIFDCLQDLFQNVGCVSLVI